MPSSTKWEAAFDAESGATLDLPQSIIESLDSSETKGLRARLQALAHLLTGLPGIHGAAVISLNEEGCLLTSGSCALFEGEGMAELDNFCSLLRSDESNSITAGLWRSVDPSHLNCGDRGLCEVRALCLSRGSQLVGFVLAAIEFGATGAIESCQRIAAAGPVLAFALRTCLQQEVWSQIDRLQELSRETLARAPWDLHFNLQSVVQQLRNIFEADAVTLFLRVQEKLRLSASTHSQLLGKAKFVSYRSGEGLTGYVYRYGRALRLSNTEDSTEVLKQTGQERIGPCFSEWNLEGSPPVRFLGVPLRFRGQVAGVLRMSRRQEMPRFSQGDEKALQFFADILGGAVAPARDLLLQRSILESATEGVIVSRLEESTDGHVISRIIMANPGAQELFGRSGHEIEGLDASEIYLPGEYASIKQELSSMIEAARSEGHAEYGPIITKMRRADGTQIPVTISYRLLADRLVQPPTFYAIGLARDTSEVEDRADRYQQLLELMSEMKIAYFRADHNGMTLASTSSDNEISGYSPEDLQHTPRTILYDDPADLSRLIRRARENHGHLSRQLVHLRRKDGEHFWGEVDLHILRNSMGQDIGSVGFYRDVTDRIQLQGFVAAETERVLSDAELFKRLEKGVALQLDYLSSLSHQLQTPLGSLIETLRNFESDEISQKRLKESLPYVISQAVVCTRLVRNLSYMDKILRGEPFKKERVPLAKLAIETKLDFRHLLKERNLDLRINDSSIEQLVRVQGHKEMFRQVLVNLIDNAIKYSFPYTDIVIRGRMWPEGNALEISNEGLSLSTKERENIFQRGYRTRGAQAAVPHGTGLGLWLVRKIVEAHGATIRCLEVLEGGKKRILFRILFPDQGTGSRRSS